MGTTNNNKVFAKPTSISIPTEPIGSIPTPVDLIERVAKGDSEDPNLALLYEDAIRDTIKRFEATGSPVVTGGEQRKRVSVDSRLKRDATAPPGNQMEEHGCRELD
jgi:hypothetical protein